MENENVLEQIIYYRKIVDRINKLECAFAREYTYKSLFLYGVFSAWEGRNKNFYLDAFENELATGEKI